MVDERVSIIVACWNELPFTRMCLESVLMFTQGPYELLLVDNASTDDTPIYLEELRQRTGPARVEVLRNETNRGFAVACNQAAALAHSRHLVLLHNDAVTTQGWLDELLAPVRSEQGKVGIVGAVSNAATGPQQIRVGYSNRIDMHALAEQRAREYAGKTIPVERLTGPCLLVRREVFEGLGGLDEAFGLGLLADIDLCGRAREAGHRVVLALGAFVHHFQRRTFAAPGLDWDKQKRESTACLEARWGPERAARLLPWPKGLQDTRTSQGRLKAPTFHQPTRPLPERPEGLQSGVALCMIVRDEETRLPICLRSVADLVDEIVVVDTGSADRTREIAASFGARVFNLAWADDFAAARNESLRRATRDWIFWLDADEWLDAENREKLKAVFAARSDPKAVYRMKLCSRFAGSDRPFAVAEHVRLFANRPGVGFRYRVHEQLEFAEEVMSGQQTPVVIWHEVALGPGAQRARFERNLRLLRLQAMDQPDDPVTLYHFGSALLDQGRIAEGIMQLRLSLERSAPEAGFRSRLYALITQGLYQLGRRPEAAEFCQEGRSHYPGNEELLFLDGVLQREQGKLEEAEASLVQLLLDQSGPGDMSSDPSLRGFKTRHQLAQVCQAQDRLEEAEAYWQAAVAEQAGFVPAWAGLIELYLNQGRWEDADQAITRLEAVHGKGVAADGFRSRLRG